MASRPTDSIAPEDQNEIRELRKEIGRRLSHARNNAGLTRRQVSELTGVAQGSIYMIEVGAQNVTVETLWRLAKVLELRLSDLFGGEPEEAVTKGTLRGLAGLVEQMTAQFGEQLKQQAAHRDHLAAMDESIADCVRVLEQVRARVLSALEGGDKAESE
jgi:transcriptional regulator with XRE-family HTH domain